MSWDYFTHARTLELLYHKLQSPVLARYQMTQIELDVLLFLANHPGWTQQRTSWRSGG